MIDQTQGLSLQRNIEAILAVVLADSKIKRREAMEQQLASIEKDIRTLERGDVVLVVPDNGNGWGSCQYDC